MKPPDSRQGPQELAVHLGIVLLLKFAALAVLWLVLVAPHRVQLDPQAMEQRLAPPSPQAPSKEQPDDRSHAR